MNPAGKRALPPAQYLAHRKRMGEERAERNRRARERRTQPRTHPA